MSFGFTFADDEVDDDLQGVIGGFEGVGLREGETKRAVGDADGGWTTSVKSRTWELGELLPYLPSRISYSSLHVALDDGTTARIRRRDLFDARFQMLVDSDGDGDGAEEKEDGASEVSVKDSDLVPGVYEGGLKTWECSLDVVRELGKRLANEGSGWKELRGRRLLELGCGTAIPSAYLLQNLFEAEQADDATPTLLHVCDFNVEVLRLVTLPNLILAFASSSASSAAPLTDDDAGELELTSSFLEEFTTALAERRMQLLFSSGAWSGIHTASDPRYDVILTSETIYNLDTLPSLLDLLSRTMRRSSQDARLPLHLVAAKILYFGVGGGVTHFVEAWSRAGGEGKAWCETVRQVSEGVGRVVLQIGLEAAA